MPQKDGVETFVELVDRYWESRERNGVDSPEAEWIRAEINGARMLLENILGFNEVERVLTEVRARTGKGIPQRARGMDRMGQRSEPSLPVLAERFPGTRN